MGGSASDTGGPGLPLGVAGAVILCWCAAALGVAFAQTTLAPVSPNAASLVSIAAILLAAWSYGRFCAATRRSHALGAGIAWFVLGIALELLIGRWVGNAWYGVFGPPDRPLLRHVLFFLWIFGPAAFARRLPV